jgi:hypothetical protein
MSVRQAASYDTGTLVVKFQTEPRHTHRNIITNLPYTEIRTRYTEFCLLQHRPHQLRGLLAEEYEILSRG